MRSRGYAQKTQLNCRQTKPRMTLYKHVEIEHAFLSEDKKHT